MADVTELSTTTVRASCHCKSNTFTLSLPTASLPLEAFLCNCHSCHRITGSAFVVYLEIPHKLVPDRPSAHFGEYRSTPDGGRFFCSRCGAHLGACAYDTDGYEIAAGLLERMEGICTIGFSIFSASSKDAGLLAHLAADFPRYAEFDNGPHFTAPPAGTQTVKTRDALRMRCHCGNVKATIHRPSHAHAADGVKAPSGTDKWRARHDMSATSRTTSGFACASWGAVPATHIEVAPETSFSRYEISAGVEQLFCGTCGGRAFVTGRGEPGVWDVALGLVDMEEQPVGALLGEWFEWAREVGSAEDAVDKEFREMLVKGLEAL